MMDAMREDVGGDRGDMMSKNQNLPELYSVSTTHLIPRGTVNDSERVSMSKKSGICGNCAPGVPTLSSMATFG